MENAMQIFKNDNFGTIRVAGTSDKPLFCLLDVAKALGYNHPARAVIQHCKGVVVLPTPTSGGVQQIKFGGESEVYRLTMKSKLPNAEQFQDWVCEEVLPSIRKHGMYMTEETLEKAITSPDFLIRLAQQIKEEQQKRFEAEQKVVELTEENQYQGELIDGLVNDISLADMRQRITKIIRKGGVESVKNGYRLLYEEFDKKYHINVMARINNCQYTGNRIDYIEKELEMLPELYELTCKLFESEYETLMKDWGKYVKRAQGCRIKKQQKHELNR